MHRHPSAGRSRSRLFGVAALFATVTLAFASCNPKPPKPLPIGDLGDSLSAFVSSPDAVPGANDWNCKPSAAHPDPVVLVPATMVNFGANFVAISPTLKNAGYCVYAFNYGMTALSLGRFGGLGDIAQSAQTLKDFVNQVLASTGASKVDLVGHSQGGMMPNYYIKRLGGAAKVRTLVALAPSNHGTTLSGIVTLGQNLNVLGFANSVLTWIGTPGLVQQEVDSSFQNALWADGDTVAGPRYVVIETNNDEVVTPYTNAFLNGPNVTNILIQDQCPDDNVGHIGIYLDSPAIQNIVNQLGPNQAGFRPTCSGYGIGL
jgi:triacylglycerol esterase/lipase EstA (alpha/beta hydrolase family)